MATTPRFVIGVLTPGADIMQIYSSLMVAGCSEISFVKDLNNSLLCKAQAIQAREDVREEEPRRKRKRPLPERISVQITEHSPSSSPSSPEDHALSPDDSPDANLSLVLNGIVNAGSFFENSHQNMCKDEEHSPLTNHTDTDALSSHSPSLPDAIESAPLLLSRVFGVGFDRKESMMSSFDDDVDGCGENDEGGVGRRKGPIVECQKCSSKIIMQQTRSLFRHIMTHASQEPYKCSECLQSSANSFNLRTHIYRKHDGKAEIIPNRTNELEDEWRTLARDCFPQHQDRINKCISYFVNCGADTLPLNAQEKKVAKMAI